MIIPLDVLKKTAHLARLDYSENELQQLLPDFQKMIDFVEKLKEVDTTGVEPLRSMTQEVNAWREDTIHSHENPSSLVQAATQHQDGFFVVPTVLPTA